MGRSSSHCGIQGGGGDDGADISVESRWCRSLDADGPDGLGLVILIDDPAGIGLGCLRDSWKGDSGLFIGRTSPRIIGQDIVDN